MRFANTTLGGGFVARGGSKADDHRCFVRGRACWADEAYFGGIVVIPFERRPH